jgi:lipopolysaccharide/colanic/teichoic acid biosynthesis glycosyltransferase
MVVDAERNGPQWSGRNDPRVTFIGRILRKTRLDELPQLLNICKGQMSFIGPRPIRQHMAAIIEEKMPFYSLRFTVKPGLTGWAQVNYDYGGSVEGHIEKFQYDLYYLKHASAFLDLFILLKTIQTVIRRPAC